MITIVPVETETLIQHAIALSQEYVTWMIATIHERYPDLDTSAFAAERSYDDVRKKFPGEHVPPFGRLYVVLSGDEACGCIALAKLSDTTCEMRTLYVRPTFRGMGIAQQLVKTVIEDARQIGYNHMRLDTLRFMENAQRLYHAVGFQDRAPYRAIPHFMQQYICFLELDLHRE